jgi:hypothetical protein
MWDAMTGGPSSSGMTAGVGPANGGARNLAPILLDAHLVSLDDAGELEGVPGQVVDVRPNAAHLLRDTRAVPRRQLDIVPPTRNHHDQYGVLNSIGIQPATATEELAVRPATRAEAAELRLPGRDVLTVARLTRDQHGRPIEYTTIVADPARTRFVYDDLPLRGPQP